MTGRDHPLVRAYLTRLDTLAGTLPPPRRAELRAELEEHLAEALPPDADDAAVTRVLARLGSPEGLVVEAGGAPVTPTTAPASDDAARLEAAALVVFALSLVATASVVLAVVASLLWVAGVVLTLLSRRWTPGDKALAVAAYGVLGFPLLFSGVLGAGAAVTIPTCTAWASSDGTSGESCTDPSAWWWLVLAGLGLLSLWVCAGIRLYRRAHRASPEGPYGIRMR